MFAVLGCAYLLESVFFITLRSLVFAIPSAKGVVSFLSEMWS